MALIVMKFGGTSVGDAAAMKQVANIVRDAVAQEQQVVVVTSAMGVPSNPADRIAAVKVTDSLLNSAKSAAEGDGEFYKRVRRELAEKHHAAIDAVIPSVDDRRTISERIDETLAGFEVLCSSIRVLGEASPRALDAIGGLGERMAAPILAGALRAVGLRATALDATEFIITNDHFLAAVPLMETTMEKTRDVILPLVESGVVPVVTGFIASTVKGIPTTLGRNGTDYSASIIAACLDADEVVNYKDVNGVLSADPRVVPEAHTIDTLTFQEMSEMSYFGAQVLHPMTVAPLVDKGIPLRAKNTFNPAHAGTLIVKEAPAGGSALKAVTAINDVSVVTVHGRGMKGVTGIAGRTFTAVARTGTSVLMFAQASSEQNICIVVPRNSAEKVKRELEAEMKRELANREIDDVDVMNDVAIITTVGASMTTTPGVSGRVFGALGQDNINVIAIAQGSSECGISLVVKSTDSKRAVRAIHRLTGN
jgi:aspartate kinase